MINCKFDILAYMPSPRLLLITFCLLSFFTGFSQKEKNREKEDDGKGLIILPAFFSSPETSVGLGAAGMYYFQTEKDSTIKTSNVQVILIYTFRNQLITELPFTFFFDKNNYWLNGGFFYYIYPFRYYGQGNDIDLEIFDNYDATYFRAELNLYRKIRSDLYLGPRFSYTNYFSITSDSENNLLTPDINGFQKGTISGLGMGLIFDRRNNLFSPDKGFYLEMSVFKFGEFTGSDFSFTNYWFDARKYIDIGEKKELGFQFIHQSVTGSDIPFYNLATLGGSSIMRGYFSGAFRDKHYTAFQSEARIYILKMFVGSVFGSMGSIRNSFGKIDNILPSGGVGLRWEIDSKEKIRIRLDYALGKGTRGFYININEAF